MPFAISVGPPVLTINQGSTFMVTDLNGEIAADTEQGVFAGDTRFVSYYALFANGEPWVRRSSSPTSYFAARIYLTTPTIATENGEIPAGTLALTVTRAVGDGIHEDLDLTNSGGSGSPDLVEPDPEVEIVLERILSLAVATHPELVPTLTWCRSHNGPALRKGSGWLSTDREEVWQAHHPPIHAHGKFSQGLG